MTCHFSLIPAKENEYNAKFNDGCKLATSEGLSSPCGYLGIYDSKIYIERIDKKMERIDKKMDRLSDF